MKLKKSLVLMITILLSMSIFSCDDNDSDARDAFMEKLRDEVSEENSNQDTEVQQTENIVKSTELEDLYTNEVDTTQPATEDNFFELEAQATKFGKCGDSVNWYLIDSELIIAGSGEMYGYNDLFNLSIETTSPWEEYEKYVSKITVQEGVTSIGYKAFSYMKNVEEITIPSTCKTIEAFSMSGCSSLEVLNLSSGVETIGLEAFMQCESLKEVVVPGSVNSFDESVFNRCTALTSVTIEDGIYELGENMFEYCTSLEDVKLPETLTNIPDSIFFGCWALESIKIPSSVKEIGYRSFYECKSLRNVELQKGLKIIGEGSFIDCNMTEIVIPETVEIIGDYAFSYCENLMTIHYPGTQAEWDEIAITQDESEVLDPLVKYNSSELAPVDLYDEDYELNNESNDINDILYF